MDVLMRLTGEPGDDDSGEHDVGVGFRGRRTHAIDDPPEDGDDDDGASGLQSMLELEGPRRRRRGLFLGGGGGVRLGRRSQRFGDLSQAAELGGLPWYGPWGVLRSSVFFVLFWDRRPSAHAGAGVAPTRGRGRRCPQAGRPPAGPRR